MWERQKSQSSNQAHNVISKLTCSVQAILTVTAQAGTIVLQMGHVRGKALLGHTHSTRFQRSENHLSQAQPSMLSCAQASAPFLERLRETPCWPCRVGGKLGFWCKMKWPQRFYFYGSPAQIKDIRSNLSAHLSHLIFLTPFRQIRGIFDLRGEIWSSIPPQHPKYLLTEKNSDYQPISLPADILL